MCHFLQLLNIFLTVGENLTLLSGLPVGFKTVTQSTQDIVVDSWMTYYKGSSPLDGIFKGTMQYFGIVTVLLIV